MVSGDGALRLLARSDTRVELLRTLNGDQPLDRYELEDRLDASRRTVTRAANTLSEQGYLRETDDGYRLTAFGSFITDAYREYRRRTELAERYRPFLRNLDPEIGLELDYLRGATLTTAAEASPYVLLDRTLKLRASATRIRELAPGVEKQSVEQLADRLRADEEFTVEVILPPGALEAAESHPEYVADHRVAREAEAVDIYVYPERVTLFIGVMDETVALASGVEGEPQALIESDDERLRTWAESRLNDYRQEATPVEAH